MENSFSILIIEDDVLLNDKYSTGYGLFALQVLGCRAIS